MARTKSTYAEIDETIAACVKSIGSTLFTEWTGVPARFFYLPGDPPFECFQISVEAPDHGRTSVSAWAVDTNDDTEHELHQKWEGPLTDLDKMLWEAVAAIDVWKGRERRRPDPPSPW